MPSRFILCFLLACFPEIYGQQALSVDNIKIGMTLADVKAVHPKANIKEVPNKYGNCADDDYTGYEIRERNKLIAFVILNTDQKIKRIVVTSPKFKFNGVNTKSTVDDILKHHPEAKLSMNSLDDWEYIYLQNPDMTIGFETDENSRIGIYDDETVVGIKRKSASVDFIIIE